MDSVRIGPSDSSSSLGRSSVLPLARLTPLKWCDEGRLRHEKPPLLILRLSSPSFLHTTVEDEARLSLYTIKTAANLTTVMRSDPWEGMTKIADIRWPELTATVKGKAKKLHDVKVQMRGHRWVNGESFLRTGSGASPTRKFTILNYSHTLKWRQVGSSYWCTTPSVKGPIAVLEPASASLPPQLQIFETFHDRYDGRPMMDHQGVSILLLDYILTTALLLVTEVQEWTFAQKDGHIDLTAPEMDACGAAEAPRLSQSAVTLTSTSQWRKIMYGEPMYPKRHAHSASCSAPTPTFPTSPRSASRLAKVMHGVPMYQKLTSGINFHSSSESDPEDEGSCSSFEQQEGPTTPAFGSALYRGGSEPSLSHISFSHPFYSGDSENSMAISHPIPPIAETSRVFQSRSTTLGSPTLELAAVHRSPSSSSHSSTALQAPSSPEDKDLPPVPNPSRNTRSPSLPVELNQPASGRSYGSRPLPQPPDINNRPPVLRHAWSQQGLVAARHRQPQYTYGSYNPPVFPIQPSQSPLSPPNVQNLVPTFIVGSVTSPYSTLPRQLFDSPVSSSHSHPHFQFSAPFTHTPRHVRQKTPNEADLVQWMEGLGTDNHSLSVASRAIEEPYDVPPPAYDSINFDE